MTAQQLHQEGRKAGESGNYKEAVDLFMQAHQADPNWPYPLYDLAYTYLLQENYEKAYEFYKKTDQLSPDGFFTTKTALWALDGEQDGDFAPGLYRAYLQSEWLPDNQRLSVLQQMMERFPRFAPAYKGLLALYRSPYLASPRATASGRALANSIIE